MADEDEVIEETPAEKPKAGKSVTGRPNDLPIVTHEHPLPNSTMASRAKARASQNKRVEPEEVETK